MYIPKKNYKTMGLKTYIPKKFYMKTTYWTLLSKKFVGAPHTHTILRPCSFVPHILFI
ncbi:hypothetical protein Hanom_Chr08g00741961 [Helianthus anomalus]